MIRIAQLRYCYSADSFKLLRVYRNYSGLQLTNALMVNRAAATPWLVANSMRLYKLAKRVIGTRLTNTIVERTFGRVFTAGKTLDEVNEMSRQFVQQGIPVIIDYCGEGFIDAKSHEAELDTNAEMFRLTAQQVSKHQNQMISIKVSGLVDMPTLRKLNLGVNNIHKFWDKNARDGVLTGEQLLQGFQAIYQGVTEEELAQFLQVIIGYEGELKEFKCDQVDWKMKVHPFYIDGQTKTNNKLAHLFCPLSTDELTLVRNLIRRIDNIVNPFADNKTNFKIIMDAEQSYIQGAIFALSEQYQKKFNKDKIYIIPTLQNYLVKAIPRLDYELEIAKRNGLMFVMKFVRGAYLVEQRRIAAENQVPCEVVDNFDKTTQNFMHNVESCLKADLIKGSQIVIASHNQETLEDIKALDKKYTNPAVQVEYAQLLGLADHLTIQLKQQGYPVYKYLPYGPTSTMVPYLIRRAQELSQMKYPLKLQYDLIIDEFKQRMGLTS